MSPVSALRWRSVAVDAIVWREWDGEFVLRNERSGSSHMLGTLAGTVLQVLLEADQALTVADIADRVDIQKMVVDDPSLFAAIDAVLVEFERLDLAVPLRQ